MNLAEQTDDLSLANTAAWTCALAPDAVEDLDACVKLAAQAVAKNPSPTLAISDVLREFIEVVQ